MRNLKLEFAGFYMLLSAFVFAADSTQTSPRSSFTINQHYAGDWSTTVHFAQSKHPDVAFRDSYPWPALFYISPDDRWILQIQKSGSGENISFLYRVESTGCIWRMEESFGNLAWTCMKRTFGVSVDDYYHTAIEFDSWDMKAGKLQFTLSGSFIKESGEEVHQLLLYDLKKHEMLAIQERKHRK